ncbi:MAG: hypothetical protein NTV88_01380 [Candidatus Micrarchaeota archaeon]|nr:hypothetical protein [Candidatus Micrarchaeota archaeon]
MQIEKDFGKRLSIMPDNPQLKLEFAPGAQKNKPTYLKRIEPDETGRGFVNRLQTRLEAEFSEKEKSYNNPEAKKILAELHEYLFSKNLEKFISKYDELKAAAHEICLPYHYRKWGGTPKNVEKNFKFTKLTGDERSAITLLMTRSHWLTTAYCNAKILKTLGDNLEAELTIMIAPAPPPTIYERIAKMAKENKGGMLASEDYCNCISMVKWKFALLALELYDAAAKTANSSLPDEKKEKSRETLKVLEQEEIKKIIRLAEILRNAKTVFFPRNAAVWFKPDAKQEAALQIIAMELLEKTDCKISRKIGYIMPLLTHLRTGEPDKFLGHYEKYLPSRTEGKRGTSQMNTICAAELLEDSELSRVAEKIKEMPKRFGL